MDTIRRRVVVKIELGADSWREAVSALEEIIFRLDEVRESGESVVTVTSGGPRAGWNLQADEDATITHDSYIAQLNKYLRERRENGPTESG